MKTNLTVQKTQNYDQFKFITANRSVKINNVKNLMRSMSEHGVLINPVIVNERLEVIDGQHRLKACEELGLDVYYIIVPNYNIKEVHALNLNQKNWSNQDYLEAYANDGNENYKRMFEFQQKNKDFAFNAIMQFITGVSGFHLKDAYYENSSTGKEKQGIGFKEGRMIVTDEDIIKAQSLANKFMQLKNFTDLYNNGTFVGSLIVTINGVKEFDFNLFLSKVERYRDKVYKCSNRSGYYQMIHNLYNYRLRSNIDLRNPVLNLRLKSK